MSRQLKRPMRPIPFRGNDCTQNPPANNYMPPQQALLKLNLGAGPSKVPGFLSVDSIAFPGLDVQADLNGLWPWADNSVSEAMASHVIEHFDAMERVHFVNELWRVLVPGGTCAIVVPHWASCRAYGDPTHKWPPVSEFWFYYLDRGWRLGKDGQPGNAPHTDATNLKGGFDCDFEFTMGYNLHPALGVRNAEYQQFAVGFYKEACQDITGTIKKRV